MSYYTRVELHFNGDAPPFEEVVECVHASFDAAAYGIADITEDLRRGWEQGSAEFSDLLAEEFQDLFCRISARFPDLPVCVRGSGEEWRDFWTREFLGGVVTFSSGPFPGTYRYHPPT